MPDEEVKPETAANEPVATPDMSKYYYPPGATEPVLKPEFANAEPAAAAAVIMEETSVPKGKLPDNFPGYGALDSAGLTTYAKVRKNLDSLEELEGIGPATAEKIREAMGESNPDEEEAD